MVPAAPGARRRASGPRAENPVADERGLLAERAGSRFGRDQIGVAPDAGAMRRWHEHFVEHGPISHFEDPARPDRFRRLPLN